jgi:magnesium chelatase subunit D
VEPLNADDATLAAILLAVAPEQLNGAVLYCDSRMASEQWCTMFHSLLPSGAPSKRIPGSVAAERLLGGLDFAATLARGQAVHERGLLAEAGGGCVVLSGATAQASTYAHLCHALDHPVTRAGRETPSVEDAAPFAVIVQQAMDDTALPPSLVERLGFHVSLDARSKPLANAAVIAGHVILARRRLSEVCTDDRTVVALAEAAARLGISSPRPVLFALAAARAHAALHDRVVPSTEDIACAARLVLAPRAREAPGDDMTSAATEAAPPEAADSPGERESPQREASTNSTSSSAQSSASGETEEGLTEVLVRAALTALPAGLLTSFEARSVTARGSGGRSGSAALRGVRGRQVGVRRGDPRGGARLDLVATLRAAIPLQRIRRHARGDAARPVELRRDDFRIRHCITPPMTTALFVVDASGSSAVQRLAEVKGAVELMLAEGYARRDRVALISFRGTSAELVLPPTHALARARRAINGLPAGGGTPLAAALDLAATLLAGLQRRGGHFVTIVLTDGRANVARDGRGGRSRAMDDALDAAVLLRAVCADVLWVDSSLRSEEPSRVLAQRAGARYLSLPSPTARGLKTAVRAYQPSLER